MPISLPASLANRIFWTGFVLGLLLAVCGCSVEPPAPPADDRPDLIEAPTSTPEPTVEFIFEPAGEEVYTITGLKAGDELAVYQQPDIKSQVLGYIPSDAAFIQIGRQLEDGEGQGWIQVDFHGLQGWTKSGFLAEQYGQLPQPLILAGRQILGELRSGEVHKLAEWIHPDLCLQFSPYQTLQDEHLRFCPEELAPALESDQVLVWGSYDGTGLPIEMTFADYIDHFVYDVDYFAAPRIGYNTAVSSGNAINNLEEVYPSGMMIEYYFPGFDPQYAGLDWRSLRLVFVQNDGRWFLTAIIHGEWTI